MSEQSEYWGKLSEKITKSSEIKNKRTYSSEVDIEFLKKYLKKEYAHLDLGAGTGEIINYTYTYVQKTVAVELFPNFSKFIVNDPSVEIINEDIRTFSTSQKFEIITSHGVLQYFDRKDAYQIYENVYSMLSPNGCFIQRIHCGIHEDISVDGFSEELQTDYFANFRHIDKEVAFLKSLQFASVEVFDLHGPELNKWENSHHYTIVCSK